MRILFRDHDRLLVTVDERESTVIVLRPADVDRAAVLRVARLVLPERAYRALARQLGCSPRPGTTVPVRGHRGAGRNGTGSTPSG